MQEQWFNEECYLGDNWLPITERWMNDSAGYGQLLVEKCEIEALLRGCLHMDLASNPHVSFRI